MQMTPQAYKRSNPQVSSEELADYCARFYLSDNLKFKAQLVERAEREGWFY